MTKKTIKRKKILTPEEKAEKKLFEALAEKGML